MNKKSGKSYSIGFDLGATKMMAIVFGRKFVPLGRCKKKTKAFMGQLSTLTRITETINEALADAGISAAQLIAIGVGCPGPLNLDKGIILDAPNLGWKNVQLKAFLEKNFGCPVSILNDVDAGLYGEFRFGAAAAARCAVGIFPGTGIGGACIYEGRIIRGKTNSCFEVGHMKVLPDGPLCGCGNKGCLEALSSRLAISGAAALAAYRGEAPKLLAAYGTNIRNYKSSAFAESIQGGDTVIETIVRDSARWLGIGAANLIHMMSPDVVIFGGGLIEALKSIYLPVISETVKNNIMPSFNNTYKIVAAQLGDDATASGAAAWALQSPKKGQPT